MANNPSIPSIEDIIPMIYADIESKKGITSSLRKTYLSSTADSITIKAFTLSDFIDDFDITISQSLQAIQTLQTEIWNLKEKIELIDLCKHQQRKSITDDQEPQPEQNRPERVEGSSNHFDTMIPRKKFQIDEDEEIEFAKRNQSDKRLYKENRKQSNHYDIEEDMRKIPTKSIKTSIRQSIRQMIKEAPVNDENRNYTNGNTHMKINPEDKIHSLLMKISKVDSYRTYFAEKYGEGNYETFIRKLNNKEFKRKTLEDELNIIAELMTQHLNKHNDNHSAKNIFNRRVNCNTSQQLRHNRSSLELQSKSSYRNINKMNTIQTRPVKHDYVQPINFSMSSYLRKSDSAKGNKQMSFSKEKTLNK